MKDSTLGLLIIGIIAVAAVTLLVTSPLVFIAIVLLLLLAK